MKRHLAVIAVLMYATVAWSQTTPSQTTPPDSDLVAAAKHNAEARRKAALNPGSVITNDMLTSRKTLSTTSGGAPVPPYQPDPAPAPKAASASAPTTSIPAMNTYAPRPPADPRLPREASSTSSAPPAVVPNTSAAPAQSTSYRPPGQ